MFRYFATGRVPLSLPKTKETYGTQDRNILRELDRNDPIPRGTDCPENGVSKADTHDVADAAPDTIDGYDCLLLGSSTWGDGNLQDDWYGFLDKIKTRDLSGKTVALFGCGDSESYPDTFCNALGTIYEELQPTGCRGSSAHTSRRITR